MQDLFHSPYFSHLHSLLGFSLTHAHTHTKPHSYAPAPQSEILDDWDELYKLIHSFTGIFFSMKYNPWFTTVLHTFGIILITLCFFTGCWGKPGEWFLHIAVNYRTVTQYYDVIQAFIHYMRKCGCESIKRCGKEIWPKKIDYIFYSFIQEPDNECRLKAKTYPKIASFLFT